MELESESLSTVSSKQPKKEDLSPELLSQKQKDDDGSLDLYDLENVKRLLLKAKISKEIIFSLKQDENKPFIFFTKDPSGHVPLVIKTEGNLSTENRKWEAMNYEIALAAKLDDTVAPIDLVGPYKILLSSYYYFNPYPKGAFPDLDQFLKQSNFSKTVMTKYDFDLLKRGKNRDQLPTYYYEQRGIERALTFAYLTCQRDVHGGNILLTVKPSKDNKQIPLIKPILIDFSYSMIEGSMTNEDGEEIFGYPSFLAANLGMDKPPSPELIAHIKSLMDQQFEPIFDHYKIETKIRDDFKKRLNTLKKAISQKEGMPWERTAKPLGKIFWPLFKEINKSISAAMKRKPKKQIIYDTDYYVNR